MDSVKTKLDKYEYTATRQSVALSAVGGTPGATRRVRQPVRRRPPRGPVSDLRFLTTDGAARQMGRPNSLLTEQISSKPALIMLEI